MENVDTRKNISIFINDSDFIPPVKKVSKAAKVEHKLFLQKSVYCIKLMIFLTTLCTEFDVDIITSRPKG